MTTFSELRVEAGLTVAEAAARTGYNERTAYRWESGEATPRQAVLEVLRSLARKPPEGDFAFIDLFAGIGGMRKGFEAVSGKCVFTSEWDKYSQLTYRANYPDDHDIAGDITKIDAADIPSHDVLLAGFPCQPFSLAGVSKKNSLNRPHGFRDDAQGTLFFDVARIIEHHRPKAFLLENVKNLRSHDGGRTFAVIMKTLRDELGYEVHTRLIDAGSVVPQHRERIFIVGFREQTDFDFESLALPARADGPKLSQILHPENGEEVAEGHFTVGPKAIVSDRYTLTAHLWKYLQNYAEKHRLKGNGFGFGLVGPNDVARTLSARYHKDGSEILVRQKGKSPRRLTPRECSRLMGFDRPGQSDFRIQVSDTQAYRQFGNAVVPLIVEAVAKHMKPWIGRDAVTEEPEEKQRAFG